MRYVICWNKILSQSSKNVFICIIGMFAKNLNF